MRYLGPVGGGGFMQYFPVLGRYVIVSLSDIRRASIYRSKFNVALGIEAQRFCVLK